MILENLSHLPSSPEATWITTWSIVEMRIHLQTTALHQNIRTLLTPLLPHRTQVPTLGQTETDQTSQFFSDRAMLTLLPGTAVHRPILRKTRATTKTTTESMSTPTRRPVMMIGLANH